MKPPNLFINKSLLAVLFSIIILSSVSYAFASPSINMTLNAAQTTPSHTVKDSSGNIIWQEITSPFATLISKLIIFYNTGLTHIRGYQLPDANTTLVGKNITQTFTASQTFGNTTIFKTSNTKNIANFTNSTGALVGTVTPQGIWTGYVNNPIGADYTIAINSTGYFIEYNGKTNQILKSSTNKTDASTVIQDAWNRVNATVATGGKGGWVDVDCGTYPMHSTLFLPISGNLTFTGHGVGCTIFTIRSGDNNNFVTFMGGPKQSFFNYFGHFQVYNILQTGKTNTAFQFNATGGGVSDTTFDDLFVWHFGKDLFCFCQQGVGGEGWNNRIINSILEYGGRSMLYANAGSELRINNDKFLYNNGTYTIDFNGTTNGIINNNFFFKNQKTDIRLENTASENIITNNLFSTSSFAGAKLGNATTIDTATFNVISNNIFNSPNDNYYIAFNGTSCCTNKNLVFGNQFSSTPVTSNFFFSGSTNVINQNNYIFGNGYPEANTFRDNTNPTRQLTFFLKGETASKTLTVRVNQTTSQGLNIPNITQTETLAVNPNTNFTSPVNQTGTASTTQNMNGAYATFIPKVTGNIQITISGTAANSLLLDGCRLDLRTSTTNMGIQGSVLAGNLVGTNWKITSATAAALVPFSHTVYKSGLTVGTPIFIDMSRAAITGGTCTLTNLDWFVREQ